MVLPAGSPLAGRPQGAPGGPLAADVVLLVVCGDLPPALLHRLPRVLVVSDVRMRKEIPVATMLVRAVWGGGGGPTMLVRAVWGRRETGGRGTGLVFRLHAWVACVACASCHAN